MNRQAARLEQLLIQIAARVDRSGGAARLVYDDHHAGDRLALVASSPSGLCELLIWRDSKGKQAARVHVLADRPSAATSLAGWLDAWAGSLSWSDRGAKQFATRLSKMASELARSYDMRIQGYPEPARVGLEAGLGPARPLVGVTGPLRGTQAEPLAVVAGGQQGSLWAAAVAAPLTGEGAERALIWDPQARAFIAPRELRAMLCAREPLPELAQKWSTWCLAPPPPQIVEQQLADIDYRTRAEGQLDAEESCFDCTYSPSFDCSLFDTGREPITCEPLSCDGFDACDVLSCID